MASQIGKEIRVLAGMAMLGFAGWGLAKWRLATTPLDSGWASIVERLGKGVGWVALAALLVVVTMTDRTGLSASRPLHVLMIWKTVVWAAIGATCLLVVVFAPSLLPRSMLLFVFATALLGVVITGAAAWAVRHARP